MLWTRDQTDVAANFAVLFGRGSGGDGGGGSSSSAAAASSSSSVVSQATDQEVGRMLWQLALLQAWQAILQVAVRQLVSPRHPLHTQIDEGDDPLFKARARPAPTPPSAPPTVANVGPTHGTAVLCLH